MSKIPPLSKKRMAAKMDGTYDKKYGKARVPTGEASTLDRLIKERGPFSEISGDPLVDDEHPKHHWQLFHVLGKGEYPELRLTDENLLLSTWQEQDAWTTRKWTLKNDPKWKPVFELEARLKLAARNVCACGYAEGQCQMGISTDCPETASI